MVSILVLIAEQQDIEIGAEQSAADGRQVLRVITEHVTFKTFAHVKHGCPPWREDPHAVAAVLTIAIQHTGCGRHTLAALQQGVDDRQVLIDDAQRETQTIEQRSLEQARPR